MSKHNPSYTSQVFLGKVGLLDATTKKVVLNAPKLYQHFLNENTKVNDEIAMYITSKRPKRSLLQNNYYALYLSLISLSSGYTPKELRSWAKQKFLSKGIKDIYGQKTPIVDSSADLRIGEFCEFLCQIEDATEIPCPKTDPFLKALTQSEYDELKQSQKLAYLRMKAKIIIN